MGKPNTCNRVKPCGFLVLQVFCGIFLFPPRVLYTDHFSVIFSTLNSRKKRHCEVSQEVGPEKPPTPGGFSQKTLQGSNIPAMRASDPSSPTARVTSPWEWWVYTQPCKSQNFAWSVADRCEMHSLEMERNSRIFWDFMYPKKNNEQLMS